MQHTHASKEKKKAQRSLKTLSAGHTRRYIQNFEKSTSRITFELTYFKQEILIHFYSSEFWLIYLDFLGIDSTFIIFNSLSSSKNFKNSRK